MNKLEKIILKVHRFLKRKPENSWNSKWILWDFGWLIIMNMMLVIALHFLKINPPWWSFFFFGMAIYFLFDWLGLSKYGKY